ncbi:hypothetical protein ABZ671_22430 [Micromonospora sp. NPDC006766]|uniref:hypothetical protein n=1 Tax=Micromonospora sp. NPDC006766 TaxID=3154778 RepID=UPI0033F50369
MVALAVLASTFSTQTVNVTPPEVKVLHAGVAASAGEAGIRASDAAVARPAAEAASVTLFAARAVLNSN